MIAIPVRRRGLFQPSQNAGSAHGDECMLLAARKYAVEVNGMIIGETSRDEVCAHLVGLQSDATYRVCVWTVGNRGVRTPSEVVNVRTVKKEQSLDRYSGFSSFFF